MNKPYHAEITTDHLFDSELTGIQKLLTTLLIVDRSLDVYDLSCLAKIPTDEVILALKGLKSRAIFKPCEIRKEVIDFVSFVYEIELLSIVNSVCETVWIDTVSSKYPQF